MSVYAKFLDISKPTKKVISESKSKKVSLKKLTKVNESDEIIDDLKALEPDIIDYIHDKEWVFTDIVEGTKYTLYEDALCINVKGRPEINVDIPDDMLETAGDYIDTYISDLANYLSEQDDDFVIYGRMGGYWGYKNFENYITINDKGLKVLKDKVIELMKDEDNTDSNSYEIVDYYKEDLADELDGRHLSISKDFLKKLEDLSSIIDDEEKKLNDELKQMVENGGVNESCGKRKPKKPFPRKTLNESAKDKFVKKVFGKSKLSESRILKRSRKVKVPMSEAERKTYIIRFTADGIKAGCIIGRKQDINSIKNIYKNKKYKEIEAAPLKDSDVEQMYYQLEKLAKSVKGEEGVDIRKTNDGKIGAIYFTDEYKGNKHKEILD